MPMIFRGGSGPRAARSHRAGGPDSEQTVAEASSRSRDPRSINVHRGPDSELTVAEAFNSQTP
jgi:hypothetical protein